MNADTGVHEALLNLRFQPFPRVIFKKMCISQLLAYNMGMASLDQYLDAQLVRGRAHFTSEAALAELRLSPLALKAAIGRMTKKQRVANLRHGFYLILRPEDRVAGADEVSGHRLPRLAAARGSLSWLLASGRHDLPGNRSEAAS
jgi:hypothetical protein